MGDVAIIAASVKILESEFVKYLEEVGGELMHSYPIRGTIHDGESAAWIQEANIELEALIEDSEDLIVPKLGGIPLTMMVVERTSDSRSLSFVVRLVKEFLKRWPSICSDGKGGYLSYDELTSMDDDAPDLASRPKEFKGRLL